jgi:hypothetical protein
MDLERKLICEEIVQTVENLLTSILIQKFMLHHEFLLRKLNRKSLQLLKLKIWKRHQLILFWTEVGGQVKVSVRKKVSNML